MRSRRCRKMACRRASRGQPLKPRRRLQLADVGSSPARLADHDPAAWPAPDQSTQVLDPDAQQTAAYPYQAQDPYQQQADAYAQAQQTTAYPNAAYDYSQQTEQPPAAPQCRHREPTAICPAARVTPTTAPPAPKSGGVGKFIAIAALTGLFAGVGVAPSGTPWRRTRDPSSVTVNAPSNPEGLSARADGSIATIAEKVPPSVVSLEVSGSGQAGSGSGFVVSQDGYIPDQQPRHRGGSRQRSIEVVLQDGTRVTGDLIGRNADYDLAVVKIDKSGLTPLAVGDSGSVKVGDQASPSALRWVWKAPSPVAS